MKKVFIYAYTAFNFGDDLFITMLINRYPQTQFLLYAPGGYKVVFRKHKNITVIESNTFAARCRNRLSRHVPFFPFPEQKLVQGCDAMVQIGGSLFMETDNWKKEWRKLAAIHNLSDNSFLLGANFGPFKQDTFYQHYRKLFTHFTDICFRDQHSYALFSNMKQVRVAPDILFGMDHPAPGNPALLKRPLIVISIIKPSIRKHLAQYDDVYRKKMKEIAVFFISSGYEVVFVALCANEGDQTMMEAIAADIPIIYAAKFSTYSHYHSASETIALLQSARLIIACRFHAMITGWTMQRSVFPIIYSEKMRNAMHDIGYQGSACDFENLHLLKPEDMMAEMVHSPIDIRKQKTAATRHFAELDRFLECAWKTNG